MEEAKNRMPYKIPFPVILKTYRSAYNYVTDEDVETKELTLQEPGMSYSDFTRTGVPTIQAIARLFEKGIRVIELPFSKTFRENKGLIVVLGQVVDIAASFHQRVRVRFPMTLTARLVYVGSASYTFMYILTDAVQGDVLMTSYRTFSNMDPATGRSIKLSPELRKEMCQNLYKGENRRVQLLNTVPTKPNNAFVQLATVRHSDSDRLYHVNQANFFTYFMDAATEAAQKDHFRILRGDLLSYRIKHMECLYKGEAYPGDELRCCVWESQDIPAELFCQIEKKDKVVWIGRVRFRLPLEALSRL